MCTTVRIVSYPGSGPMGEERVLSMVHTLLGVGYAPLTTLMSERWALGRV